MSVKKILIAPHPKLRQTAEPIVDLNPQTIAYIRSLADTITAQKDPAAAGLALPQIDALYRAFATNLETRHSDEFQVRVFVNPILIDRSDNLSIGPDRRRPDLEGCLSIPYLYGPILRPEWVTFEFQELIGDQLSDPKRETFYDFPGRVMQHENDHLEGILFTDYTLQQGQPLFRSEKHELIPVDPIIAQAFRAPQA